MANKLKDSPYLPHGPRPLTTPALVVAVQPEPALLERGLPPLPVRLPRNPEPSCSRWNRRWNRRRSFSGWRWGVR